MNQQADVPLPPDCAPIDTAIDTAIDTRVGHATDAGADHRVVALWMQTWGTPGRQAFAAWRAGWQEPAETAEGAARSADHATVAMWLQTWVKAGAQPGRQSFGAWIAAGNG